MCGIIGYVGKDANSLDVLLEGLSSLEYRGYDSAGIAAFDENERLCVVKNAGRVASIEDEARAIGPSRCGIGHTRWATHGEPSKENSHPHGTERLQIVHNGIIENYACLKSELTKLGYTFESDTDTEVAAKLIDYYYMKSGRHLESVFNAAERFCGSFALGIVFANAPDTIYAVRKDSPLIIGVGDGENCISSDITAVLNRTRRYYRLEDNDVAQIRADRVDIFNARVNVNDRREVYTAEWSVEQAEKGGFDHFMQKEIYEEPDAVVKTLRPRVHDMLPDFKFETLDDDALRDTARLHIVACGTAMHAGLIGKTMIEELARIPVSVEIASEFRYSFPILDKNDMVIVISQSGETADSLAALRLANSMGVRTLAIVNVAGSTIAREAQNVLNTWAGPEIAVASTKAYTTQAALLTLFAVHLALIKDRIDKSEAICLTHELLHELPRAISSVLEQTDEIRELAKAISEKEDLFFIGRTVDYCLCREASLKLKEISYIHSEAYAAGELKHGTISLITNGVPVIAIATRRELFDKIASNIREVASRGGEVSLITSGDLVCDGVERTIRLPDISDRLSVFTAAAVCQLLAYYTSVIRGCDVDKPRNLAKSVTVE